MDKWVYVKASSYVEEQSFFRKSNKSAFIQQWHLVFTCYLHFCHCWPTISLSTPFDFRSSCLKHLKAFRPLGNFIIRVSMPSHLAGAENIRMRQYCYSVMHIKQVFVRNLRDINVCDVLKFELLQWWLLEFTFKLRG